MTENEIKPYVGKPVRLTMADGQILAGTLHAHGDQGGHGHVHYAVVSAPLKAGDEPVAVMIHGSERIAKIEDAAGDPAARE